MRGSDRSLSLEAKLDKAMKIFWERGYYDTSIDRLMARSGLNRAVIYREFGNKKKLFEALLVRYRSIYIAEWTAPLAMPEAGLAQIEDFFRLIGSVEQQPGGRLGCLMCLTASEVSPHVRSVERIVTNFLDDLRRLLRAAFVRAKERGEVRPTTDPDFVADYAVGAVLGFWALARSPASQDAVARYVEGVLTFLRNLEPVHGQGGAQ
jgi:TetR/AcrR family transcriptional regulator, transcriptional repressor for nem operon